MITRTKREWCAMLAKLVAPMDAETAARAFVDMLPMLPDDDTLYCRDTLDRAATCDRRTAVPTFADISRVLGQAAKDRMPYRERTGYTPPAWPQIDAPKATDDERAVACARAEGIKAELRAMGGATKGPDEKPTPRYLTPLQLALDAQRTGAIMRPDWARALAEHNGAPEIQ